MLAYLFLVLFIALIAGGIYLLWLPGLRIQSVTASGPSADIAKQVVLTDVGGTYFHIIPKNSIFFYPQSKIRAAILDVVPDASAVSLKRDSFSSLRVITVPREEAFIWCGTTIDTPYPSGCYQADVQGFIFAPQNTGTTSMPIASTTAAHEQVQVYASLDKDVSSGQSPIRAHVDSASQLPDALKFVDAMRTLGAPVSALAIRGDEADLWLNAKTRITYVLGQEKEAADVAASALPTLSLTDGSIQYIDLRFPGKAYVKRYGS